MADGRPYRIYFRAVTGIVGRHDFAAADDDEALALAEILSEACSDECTSFELWHHTRLVVPERTAPLRPALGADEINAAMQASLIEREEAIQQSDWAIARSKRLLERLDHLGTNPRERHVKVGLPPRSTKRPTMLDDWDVVRAAQHMIELHAGRAAAVAKERASHSDGIPQVKRWQAIASAIKELEERKGSR
jgi:hypothetical protein